MKTCELSTEPDVLKPLKICGRPTTLGVRFISGPTPACPQCILESKGYIQPYDVFTLATEQGK